MTNARPPRGTGAVVTSRPASLDTHGTASRRRWSSRELHVELHKNTARLYGGRIVDLLDLAGVQQRQYDRPRRCWTVPLNRADDVITAAQFRQRRHVTVTEVTR